MGLVLGVLLGSRVAPVLAEAANIDAWVDRNPVAANESLQLTLEADGDPDGDPDFTPLKRDFEILSHATGSNVQIINGRVKRSVQWVLGLMPRRAGELQIPSIRFGRDRSPSIALTVSEALATDPTSADIYLEVDAQPRQPYVQEQVIYTVRLYRAVDTANATLNAPEFPGGEALIEKLGEDINHEERRQGRRFQVTERRYAIYPQRSGRLDIPAVRFAGQVVQTRRNVWDPFGTSYRPRQVRSAGIELEVRPIPADYPGAYWLPARELRLAQAWASSPATFQVGEPSTHTLAIIADGLTAAQLPDVILPLPDDAKGYPDQPELRDDTSPDGIAGLRQQKVAVIPQNAGEIAFPEITLTWWNTATDSAETARLPAQTFHVEPSAAPPPAPPVQAAPPVGTPAKSPAPDGTGPDSLPGASPGATSEPFAGTPAGAANGAQPTPANGNGEARAATPWDVLRGAGFWPWLSLGLMLAWLLTLGLWWRSHRRRQLGGRTQASPAPSPPKPSLRAIRAAADAGDPHAAKDALLAWTAAHWPAPAPANLEAIRRRLPEHSALAEVIGTLNQRLYAPGRDAWSGQALKATLGELELKFSETREEADDLEPLYR